MSGKKYLDTMFICLGLVALSIIGQLRAQELWNKTATISIKKCDTEICQQRAKMLSDIIKVSSNPCEDFYDYVCTQWRKKNPLPPYQGAWTVSNAMESNAYDILAKLLKADIKQAESEVEKQAKISYKECMSLPWMGQRDVDSIKSIIKSIGFWPMFSNMDSGKTPKRQTWLEIHNRYLTLTGKPALFDIIILPGDNKEPMLHFRPIVTPFGMIRRRANQMMNSQEVNKYQEFLAILAEVVAPITMESISRSAMKNELKDVIEFRLKLYQISHKCTVDWYNEHITQICDYRSDPIKKINQIYSDIVGSTSHINWLSIVKALYPQRKDITEDKVIGLAGADYFSDLIQLLKETPEATIKNHIHLYYAERYLKYNDDLSKMLYESFDPQFADIDYQMPQHSQCVLQLGLRNVLEEMLIGYIFPLSSKKEIEELFKDIQDILTVQISDSLFRLPARKAMINKVLRTNLQIGLPKQQNMPKDVQAVLMSIFPNVLYNKNLNTIFINTAQMQAPVFTPSLPPVVTYATIGVILAHGLYYGLDPNRIHYDAQGNHQAFSEATTYDKKIECIKKQYETYSIKELQHCNKIYKIDGIRTLAENFGDIMGLKAAYMGYRRKLHKNNYLCLTLPGFEHSTCDQLFFISYASTHCANIAGRTLIENLSKDTHSPQRIRVNAPLSNMPEFGQAFNCPKKKAPLYPAEVCDIWK